MRERISSNKCRKKWKIIKLNAGEIDLDNRDVAVALHQIPKVGTGLLIQLDQIVEGNWLRLVKEPQLLHQLKLPVALIEEMKKHLHAERIKERRAYLDELGIHVVMWRDEQYPYALAEIVQPPFILYGVGNIHLLSETDCIGVVGTRVPSSYGKMVAHRLSADLASSGWTVVSGMAAGIDADAHRGALSVHGKTIAVLGCGLNVIFPKENTRLYYEIREKGLILSEYPPEMAPNKGLFPQRNRIISGLSRGIVVVESHNRSGSLITATWALEQGREVFAVPGSILSAKSAGPNQLIKEGAKLITSAADIIAELQYPDIIDSITRMHDEAAPALSEDESELLALISYNQMHIDEIFLSTSIPRGKIHQALMQLEAKSFIRKLPGYYYIKK